MNKILIVEDQVDILKLLAMVLQTEDRKVFLAKSGEEAVTLALENLPDLVLLDIMLPGGIDGYEVARCLRRNQSTARCGIIVMTAKVQAEDKIAALDAGADDFIAKPYNLEDLKSRVARLLPAQAAG